MKVIRYQSEEEAQADLEDRLSDDFIIVTDVEIEPTSFPGRRLKPDLVAMPRDPEYSDLLVAFEVKVGSPKGTGDYAKHLKQAADYVLGRIISARSSGEGRELVLNRSIQAAFLFPGYDDDYFGGVQEKLLRLYGMHQLAARFKVGRTKFVKTGLALVMGAGANDVWVQGRGWTPHARALVRGKRQIGSQRIKLEI